ncbi:uncharacterized protein [Antedon mediterranea]|uniref:uncharacterized protein n=1 Tax=Antedon mediterranea TaxID=105859 RepID=UPI003AF86F00
MIAIMAVLRRIVADLVILNVVLLSLSSCCVGRVINTRDVAGDQLLERELDDFKVKWLLDKLMSLVSNEENVEITTVESIQTTAPSTTTAQKPVDNTVYIQHIVNCYKSYRFITEQGLSERDNIYNIVNVQCMADPTVERFVKVLTAYYTYKLNKDIGYSDYAVVEWLFSIFDEDTEDNQINTDVYQEEVKTTAAQPTIEPTSENTTTRKVEPTTLKQETTEEQDANVPTTSYPLNEENNGEDLVRELQLERILNILKKQRG